MLTRLTLIHDWHAPIASLFYDDETGPVRYEAPEGAIDGDITHKRPCRIQNGRIGLMMDTAVNVVDDVLQDELSRGRRRLPQYLDCTASPIYSIATRTPSAPTTSPSSRPTRYSRITSPTSYRSSARSRSINPYGSSNAEAIQGASCVSLNTIYRSTYGIMQFAQAIAPNPELVAVERQGEAPQIIKYRTKSNEAAQIAIMAETFQASGHNTLGIICQTQKQARRMALCA